MHGGAGARCPVTDATGAPPQVVVARERAHMEELGVYESYPDAPGHAPEGAGAPRASGGAARASAEELGFEGSLGEVLPPVPLPYAGGRGPALQPYSRWRTVDREAEAAPDEGGTAIPDWNLWPL
jgi:hypothetical protein